MAKEIERKFLVKNDSYRAMARDVNHIIQAYLNSNPAATVRLRSYDGKAYLTVKSITVGATRNEWEYEIPADDLESMLKNCHFDGNVIMKKRYILEYDGHIWEIDEFEGSLAPLVVAEIELKSENEIFELPPFIGEEVTGNPAYYNSSLAGISKLKL